MVGAACIQTLVVPERGGREEEASVLVHWAVSQGITVSCASALEEYFQQQTEWFANKQTSGTNPEKESIYVRPPSN